MITTEFTYQQFRDELVSLYQQLKAADIFIVLSAETVARTLAHKLYGEWFNEMMFDIDQHIGWSEFDDGISGAYDARGVSGPVKLHWYFDMDHPVEKTLALQFKLAFGGAA